MTCHLVVLSYAVACVNHVAQGSAAVVSAACSVAWFAQTLVLWRLRPLAPSQPPRAVREIASHETIKRG